MLLKNDINDKGIINGRFSVLSVALFGLRLLCRVLVVPARQGVPAQASTGECYRNYFLIDVYELSYVSLNLCMS